MTHHQIERDFVCSVSVVPFESSNNGSPRCPLQFDDISFLSQEAWMIVNWRISFFFMDGGQTRLKFNKENINSYVQDFPAASSNTAQN